jgi:hypothetical protein
MIITPQDVYISYQQARSRYINRPYKIPKDWDKVWSKLGEKSVYNVEMIAKAFSTRLQNVDMAKYFDCGFQLFGKGFIYSKFYDRKILLNYIEQDKQQKRKEVSVSETYDMSKKFILDWVKEKKHREDLSIYSQYCRMTDDGLRAPIKHYLNNGIDKYMLTWLIKNKYLVLEDYEKNLIPLVVQKYRQFSNEIKHIGG